MWDSEIVEYQLAKLVKELADDGIEPCDIYEGLLDFIDEYKAKA